MPLDGSLSERLPTDEEAAKALSATQALAGLLDDSGTLSLNLRAAKAKELTIELPSAISDLVLELLLLIGKGEAVTLVPFGAELSTQEAADLLNVSRPFLVKLIDEKKIGCHKVGTHRRLKADDVLNYKHTRDKERDASLQTLATLGQEIDAE